MLNLCRLPRLRVRETGPGTPFKRKTIKPSPARELKQLKYPDDVVSAVKHEWRFKNTRQLAQRFGISEMIIRTWVAGTVRSGVPPLPATPQVEQWIHERTNHPAEQDVPRL